MLWGLVVAMLLLVVGHLGAAGSATEASVRLAVGDAMVEQTEVKPELEREDGPDDDDDSMHGNDPGLVPGPAHGGGTALAAGCVEGPGRDHSRRVFRPPIA